VNPAMEKMRNAGLEAQGRNAYEYWRENIGPWEDIPWQNLPPSRKAQWIALVSSASDAFLEAFADAAPVHECKAGCPLHDPGDGHSLAGYAGNH
jgi:hypothetical protein